MPRDSTLIAYKIVFFPVAHFMCAMYSAFSLFVFAVSSHSLTLSVFFCSEEMTEILYSPLGILATTH